VQQGDLYRLVSPYNSTYASLMYVNEAKTRAVIYVWGLTRGIQHDFPAPIRLQGLATDKSYKVNEINVLDKKFHSRVNGKKLRADALMMMGVPVKLRGDYDSAVFELVAE